MFLKSRRCDFNAIAQIRLWYDVKQLKNRMTVKFFVWIVETVSKKTEKRPNLLFGSFWGYFWLSFWISSHMIVMPLHILDPSKTWNDSRNFVRIVDNYGNYNQVYNWRFLGHFGATFGFICLSQSFDFDAIAHKGLWYGLEGLYEISFES